MADRDNINVTWHGHATVQLSAQSADIIIDPFLSGNPGATVAVDKLNPNWIVVTHGHGDHVADVESIAQRTGAQLVSNPEICGWFAARGVENSAQMNIGGWTGFPFGRIKFTPAWHSSSLPDGSYGGMPMGVLLELAGKRIYHAGDTGLFSDMKLIGREGIDLAFLPIGSNYTMGPDEALEAARLLNAGTIVPVHFGTFPAIAQDAVQFKQRVEAETGSRCLLPAAGEAFGF